MARTYLFFQPTRLPLGPGDLDGSTVVSVAHTPEVVTRIEQAFPGLQWHSPHSASAVVRGNWYEVNLPETAENTLAVRCSLRASHDEFVQELCDCFGWLAFDERPMCFQPNRAPFPV